MLPKYCTHLKVTLGYKISWTRTAGYEEAFTKLKSEISSASVLALYDIKAEPKVSVDASA